MTAALDPYLSDPRVRHVTTGRRVGAARNMTCLIQSATAPYVALLHDDDRWQPEFLERRVAFLEDNCDCGYVFSEHLDIDAEDRVVERSDVGLRPGRVRREDFVPRMLERNLAATPTVLVRRTLYEAVGATL